MAQQTKKVRHVQKHDVEANWLKATGFTPLAGEIIIYDEDELHSSKRVKIGNGITNINDLPFQPDQAIVNVFDRLPEDDINTGVFYRLITGTFVFNQSVQSKMFCYCVEALPNEGFPALSGDLSSISNATITAYYSVLDDDVYGYVSEQLSTIFGVSVGWHPCAVLMETVGESFGGIIVNIKDDPMDNTFRLLLEYKLYYYNDQWEPLKEEQEVIQSDWNQTDDTQPDYIKNKPDVAQSDWDIADESDPAAIKNKPFGMVEQMIDIVPEQSYQFWVVGSENQIGNIGQSIPFQDNTIYQVWFNGEYIGAAKPDEHINIPDGTFEFVEGGFIIHGGNYPEGQYTVRISGPQRVTKKLDSQWLNIQDDIYSGDMTDPVSGGAVATALSNFGSNITSLSNQINYQIIPAIGSIPTEADNNKVLTVIDGEASWELPVNGISVTDDGEGNVEIITATNGSGGVMRQEQIEALYGLLKIAAYTEDATEEHDAFLAAFGIDSNTPDESTVINLFDKNGMCIDDKYINGVGIIRANVGSQLAKIPVEPNTTYAIQFGYDGNTFPAAAIGSLAMYDASDALICKTNSSALEFTDGSGAIWFADLNNDVSGKGHTFTTTENCAYIYFTAHLNDSESVIDTAMLEIGDVCHDYVPYVDGGDTPDAPEEPTDTNLFDKETMCIDDKYINGAGKIQSNAGSKLAQIPVEPNKTYAIQFEEALPGAKIGSIAMMASSDATTAICRASSVTLGFLPYGSNAMADKVTDLTKNSEGYIYTFTTVEGCYFICFTAHLNDTASVIDAVTMWEV